MWLFISQEILFFSGLFAAFFYIQMVYPEAVTTARKTMSIPLGTVNGVVLLLSSLIMSLCVRQA